MIPGFERRYQGQSPHYETYYGKIDIAPNRALWFRYTTLDGTKQEASCWAIFFDDGECTGGKETYALEELDARRDAYHISDEVHLDQECAVGRAGEISWDISWRDSGRRFSYMPHALEKVGIARSTYDDCLLDLRVEGTVRCGDLEIEIDEAPGMVGHIQGARIMGDSWAWSHCNCFDDDKDAAFEGLSVRALLGGWTTPTLTAFVLWVDGQQYTFRHPIGILLNDSEYSRDRWRFSARKGDVVLSGEARAPDNVALVEYTDTDGSNLWCYNSKLSDLTLHIQDPARDLNRTLTSTGRAAFEHVNRKVPEEEPIV